MIVYRTDAGPKLDGYPPKFVDFSWDLLEQADDGWLSVQSDAITLNLINARVVYQIIESNFTPDRYVTARLDSLEWR